MESNLDAVTEVALSVNGDVALDIKSTDQLTEVGDITVDTRVRRKAKRLLKQHSKDSIETSVVQPTKRVWKNSRKPRNGFKRGFPKKGGAGGKGVWGKPGSESDNVANTDKNDPNYDSDSLESANVELTSVMPELTDEELKKNIEIIILEYYEHGDTEEAIVSIDELNCNSKKYMIPVHAIEISLDHKPSHREMTSVLLCDLSVSTIKQKEMIQAFTVLLENLPDLVLDIPDVSFEVANFIARAIADQCMQPKTINIFRDNCNNDIARQAVARADALLESQRGLYSLDNVWGIGGGLRPVKILVRQMNILLEEYLANGDIQEATRCLLELEVPHFHHELVYEAIILTLESLNSVVEESMCGLLKSLSDAIIISPDMMERGFLRVYEDMPDIAIDVPLATTVLERFVDQCYKAGFISENLVMKVPTRGRKRFVSEGDGGRVKEHYY